MTMKKEMRVCRLCEVEKELELFEIDSRVKGKYTSRCKACKAGLNDRARTLYSSLKYRADNHGQKLEVTLQELRRLLTAFDGKCIYCDKTEDEAGTSHHVDHIIPASKKGRHHISNLVVACHSCNASKGNMPFFQFYTRKKEEIKDENLNTLIHYIALTSGQPANDIIKDLIIDYKLDQYQNLINEEYIDKADVEQAVSQVF